jgi:hypothetical protein
MVCSGSSQRVILLRISTKTSEIVYQSLNFAVNELDILFDLVNFEFVAAISDGMIVGLLVLAVSEGRAVEEVVPIKKLIVLFIVVFESYCFGLGDA